MARKPQTVTDTAPQTTDTAILTMADCKAALFEALKDSANTASKRKEDNKQNGEAVTAAYGRVTYILQDILSLLPNRMDILPWCESLINDSFASGGDSNRNKEKRSQLAKGVSEVLADDIAILSKDTASAMLARGEDISTFYGKGLYLVKPAGQYLFMIANLPKPPTVGETAMERLIKACTDKGQGTNWMAVEAAILELQELLQKQRTDKPEKIVSIDIHAMVS